MPERGDIATRFTSENAAEAGSRGGRAAQAHRLAGLSEAADTLPPLDSPENAMKRLEIIGDLAVAGKLPGAQAGAAARTVEIWLKAELLKQDRERMHELEEMITRLEADLAAARQSSMRAV